MPTTMTSHRDAARAWESLLRAQSALMRQFESQGDFEPVSAREYDVLYHLSLAPAEGLRVSGLAQAALLPQPSLSRVVERLEGRGFVQRLPASEDGRGVMVALTAVGAATQRRVGARHVRSIHAVVASALDSDEARELTRLCEALLAGLGRGEAGTLR